MQKDITVFAIRFTIVNPTAAAPFPHEAIKCLFEAIARRLKSHQEAMICHVKGLCETSSGLELLKASYVSDRSGVAFSGRWKDDAQSVFLTLNVIALHIPMAGLSCAVRASITETEKICGVSFTENRTPAYENRIIYPKKEVS